MTMRQHFTWRLLNSHYQILTSKDQTFKNNNNQQLQTAGLTYFFWWKVRDHSAHYTPSKHHQARRNHLAAGRVGDRRGNNYNRRRIDCRHPELRRSNRKAWTRWERLALERRRWAFRCWIGEWGLWEYLPLFFGGGLWVWANRLEQNELLKS